MFPMGPPIYIFLFKLIRELLMLFPLDTVRLRTAKAIIVSLGYTLTLLAVALSFRTGVISCIIRIFNHGTLVANS